VKYWITLEWTWIDISIKIMINILRIVIPDLNAALISSKNAALSDEY